MVPLVKLSDPMPAYFSAVFTPDKEDERDSGVGFCCAD